MSVLSVTRDPRLPEVIEHSHLFRAAILGCHIFLRHFRQMSDAIIPEVEIRVPVTFARIIFS